MQEKSKRGGIQKLDRNFFEALQQLGNNLKQIATDAVISYFENRGIFVLIYGDNALGILHTGQVLNSSGNTASEVDFRFYCSTSLSGSFTPKFIIIGRKR